ncbi:carbohydrate ABC transporter permease, partial [Clostridioides difficile]
MTSKVRAVFGMPKRLNRSFTVSLMLFALLGVFGSFMVLPLIYAVNNAFKPLDELFIFPPRFWVNN